MDEPARRDGIGTYEALLYVGVYFIAQFTAFVLVVSLRAAGSGAHFDEAALSAGTEPVTLFGVTACAGIATLLVGTIATREDRGARDAFRLAPPSIVGALGALALGAGASVLLSELDNQLVAWAAAQADSGAGGRIAAWFARDPESDVRSLAMLQPTSIAGALGNIAAFVLAAPLFEETVFRGFLLPRLQHREGPRVAVFVTALAFGLVHPEARAAITASLMGLVFGALALRAASTTPAILAHAAFNAVPVAIGIAHLEAPGILSAESSHVPTPWLLAAASSLIVGVVLTVAARPGPALERDVTPGRGPSEP